jgi:hypothetical protein
MMMQTRMTPSNPSAAPIKLPISFGRLVSPLVTPAAPAVAAALALRFSRLLAARAARGAETVATAAMEPAAMLLSEIFCIYGLAK